MECYKDQLVSVIICAFSLERFDMTTECIYSVMNNTYKNHEIILIIDGNEVLKQKMKSKFEEVKNMTIIGNDKNEGASVSRNLGIQYAKGEIVAFVDDDGYVSSDWLEHIIKDFYDYPKILVVGGKLIPVYEYGSNKLPEEILWIVGGTYKGHPENLQVVRNVFTGNMAVRRSVFKDINFEIMYGKKETFLYCQLSHQLEDTLFCVRINSMRTDAILYDPEMVAYHHVYKERLTFRYIVREAFFEGVLKAKLEHINGNDTLYSEHNYLTFILTSIIKDLCAFKIRDGVLLLSTTFSVSTGYVCYLLKEKCFNMRS